MSDGEKTKKSQQLYAKYQAQRRRETEDQHRRDTKAKIILGGTAVAAMNADPEFRRQFGALIEKYIRDTERKYIEQWLPQQPPTA